MTNNTERATKRAFPIILFRRRLTLERVKFLQMISFGFGAILIVVPFGCFPLAAFAEIWAFETVVYDTNPYCKASRLSMVSLIV